MFAVRTMPVLATLARRTFAITARATAPACRTLHCGAGTAARPQPRTAISFARVARWTARPRFARANQTQAGAKEGEGAAQPKSNYKTRQQVAEEAGEEMNELAPLTTKEKIRAGRNLTVAALIAAGAGATGYAFFQQVFGALSPTVIFDRAFDKAKQFSEVEHRLGKPLKAYGRDHGGHREGRRNVVENVAYDDELGVKHVRIAFNVEGRYGKGTIYAEVKKGMSKGEFHYLLFEDHRSRDVIALIDNRKELKREEIQELVAKRLNEEESVLYGTDKCPWTKRQKEELGQWAKDIEYVRCDKEEEKCKEAGIPGYPSWRFRGQMVPGFKRLEELRALMKQLKQAGPLG